MREERVPYRGWGVPYQEGACYIGDGICHIRAGTCRSIDGMGCAASEQHQSSIREHGRALYMHVRMSARHNFRASGWRVAPPGQARPSYGRPTPLTWHNLPNMAGESRLPAKRAVRGRASVGLAPLRTRAHRPSARCEGAHTRARTGPFCSSTGRSAAPIVGDGLCHTPPAGGGSTRWTCWHTRVQTEPAPRGGSSGRSKSYACASLRPKPAVFGRGAPD